MKIQIFSNGTKKACYPESWQRLDWHIPPEEASHAIAVRFPPEFAIDGISGFIIFADTTDGYTLLHDKQYGCLNCESARLAHAKMQLQVTKLYPDDAAMYGAWVEDSDEQGEAFRPDQRERS